MLRFRTNSKSTPRSFRTISWRERIRLWILVIALGLVLLAMRRMQHPQVQENLQRWLFLDGNPLRQDQILNQASLKNSTEETVGTSASSLATNLDREMAFVPSKGATRVTHDLSDQGSPIDSSTLQELLQNVRDNTPFRQQEQTAWFAIWACLQQELQEDLLRKSVGNLSYAQLIGQPATYRGRVVTLRGTVLREECLRAPENLVGIDRYHRLVMQPSGGGELPFVVYTLNLPERFPRGNALREKVNVTGYFFKNWSYAWQDGLELAPVVLAGNVRWFELSVGGMSQKLKSRSSNKGMWSFSEKQVFGGVVGGIGMAAMLGLFFREPIQRMLQGLTGAKRNRLHTIPTDDRVVRELRQLAERESHE